MTASVSGMNFRVFWSTFFRSSGRLLLMAFQSFTPPANIRVGHQHSPIAVRRHLLSRETGFEKARFSFEHVPPCFPVATGSRGWAGSTSSGRGLWNSEMPMSGQKTPQPSHSRPAAAGSPRRACSNAA